MKKSPLCYWRYCALLCFLLVLSTTLCYSQVPRYLITTIPEVLEDNDEPVTIIFDASQGNGALANVVGSVYAHTGVTTEDGGWQYQPTTSPELINIGDYKWKLTMPNGIRNFYGVVASKSISQIDILFKNADGTVWVKGTGDTDIAISVGKLWDIYPEKPTINEPIVVTFNALFSNPVDASKTLKGYEGNVYAHTGVTTSNGNWQKKTDWNTNSDKYKLQKIGPNRWQFIIPNGIEEFYGVNEEVAQLNFVFRAADGSKQSEDIFIPIYPELCKVSKSFPTANEALTFTFDLSAGNSAISSTETELYAHTGVTIGGADWQHSSSWTTLDDKYKLTSLGGSKWKLEMTNGINTFYAVTEGQKVEKVSFVIRDAAGNTCKSANGSDIFVDIFDAGLNVSFNTPKQSITVKQGEKINFYGVASSNSTLTLEDDTSTILLSTATTSISGNHSYSNPGTYTWTLSANDGINTAETSIEINVLDKTIITPLPEGVKPGINYNGNGTVTLALEAPYKQEAYVVGDFNNWNYSPDYQMKKDGDIFWITIDNLTAGEEYAYQYVVDGSITIADPYTEKVLDPWNDQYISESIYPNIKTYPEGGKGIVSVFQTNQNPYSWETTGYTRPEKQDLIIYEMHLRDFTSEGSFKGAQAKIPYLKELGINAIELMPTNEFEGNDSWGYNPSFYFATDKAYGTKDDFKSFIDECHANGIAVIIDLVLNHSFGQSPLLHLYQDETGTPLRESPWYNQKSNIENPGLQWGADFNHESFYTRAFVDRVNAYWLTEFKIDGIRYDFTKGFSNTTFNMATDEWANAYDGGRIYNLKRMKEEIDKVSPGAYLICEHLTSYMEEHELGLAGFMMWRNMNEQYGQVAMGYSNDSDLSRMYEWTETNGMPTNSLVGYMESHDEERIAYKASEYGATPIKENISNSMKQLATSTAFFLTVPGPKMIWQFGELGYDISIDAGGRTAKKPIKWEYYDDADRKYLFDVYSKLLYLRKNYPALFRARGDFSGDYGFKWNVTESSWDGGRMILSKAVDKSMLIVGNFTANEANCYAEYTNTGQWYDVMEGTFVDVTSITGDISVPAHSFKLLVNFDPGYYLAHSSDASKDLSAQKVVKYRSGGWKGTTVRGMNDALKKNSPIIDGSKINSTLQEVDMTEATLDGSLTGLLDACAAITAINMPHLNYEGGPESGANPNCLIYVPTGASANDNRRLENIISGNQALGDIYIEDAHPFRIAQSFNTGEKYVHYTRSFKGAGADGGWQTICLPFNAFSVSEAKYAYTGNMKPVTPDQSGDYWLKKYMNNNETTVNFNNADAIEAHTPYLIAFPGKYWGEEFPENWSVTFSGKNAEFDTGKSGTTTSGGYHFKGNYDNLKDDETTAAYYILNSGENRFEKVTNQELKPFYSYFIDGVATESSKATALSIGNGSDGATGFIELNQEKELAYTVESNKGEIIIHINEKAEIRIYDLNGQLLYQKLLESGSNRINLQKGVYILNQNKVIVH